MMAYQHLRALPRRPWALWLALLLAVFGATAPTLSHALVWLGGGASPMVEICTSNGPRWVALKPVSSSAALLTDIAPLQADGQVAPAAAPVLDHCPFCLLGADRAAPAPCVWRADFGAQDAPLPVGIVRPVFYPTFLAPAPPPRGPPGMS